MPGSGSGTATSLPEEKPRASLLPHATAPGAAGPPQADSPPRLGSGSSNLNPAASAEPGPRQLLPDIPLSPQLGTQTQTHTDTPYLRLALRSAAAPSFPNGHRSDAGPAWGGGVPVVLSNGGGRLSAPWPLPVAAPRRQRTRGPLAGLLSPRPTGAAAPASLHQATASDRAAAPAAEG